MLWVVELGSALRFGESGGAGWGWRGLVVRHTEIGVGVGRWWTAA